MQQRTNPALDARILASLAEQKAYQAKHVGRADTAECFRDAADLWHEAFLVCQPKSANEKWSEERTQFCFYEYWRITAMRNGAIITDFFEVKNAYKSRYGIKGKRKKK